jgi:serine/threonine protein kinase
VRLLIQIRIEEVSGSMSTRSTSIFKDHVVKHLSLLHDKYVIVSDDKTPKNIVFVCKSYYINCLIEELGIDNSLGNPTLYPTTLTQEGILDNHRSVLYSFGISTKMKNWIYRHSHGFLIYTCVLSDSAILLGLPNAP